MPIESFIIKHKDMFVRENSRSGGIFTALTDIILDEKGVVYGCQLDSDYVAYHGRSETIEGRDRFRGSKYIQSDLKDTFRQVKKDLVDGRTVLFSGTSCQIAGLKAYCASVNTDNLYCMLQNGNHQSGNYTKHQYPLKGKVYCGYCQKLMKYRVLKKLGPSFNCRFSATAVDSPCKRVPIAEELLEHIVRNALAAQIKQAEYVLEILHERERKALICFSALERQEEKLSAEKAEIVKQRVTLYEQYADGNMSKEEFIRQRDAYRVQEDERMGQIKRLRTEKNQIFQPVKKDTDNLQAVMNTVGEAGDVMHLSQNVVETFIDRIEVFNDECVKIRFTFEDVLKSYEAE